MTRRKSGPYYVYRVFDAVGQLIYIGCTNDLFRRLAQQEELAWWAPQAVKVKASVHANYEAGLAAERKAIQTEHPRWNVGARKWRRNKDWTHQQYVDYVTAILNAGYLCDGNRRVIEEIQVICRTRFGTELRVPPPIVPDRNGIHRNLIFSISEKPAVAGVA